MWLIVADVESSVLDVVAAYDAVVAVVVVEADVAVCVLYCPFHRIAMVEWRTVVVAVAAWVEVQFAVAFAAVVAAADDDDDVVELKHVVAVVVVSVVRYAFVVAEAVAFVEMD